MIPECITFDTETEPIQQRPEYPPRPVGWALKWPHQQSRYYAFGHPTGNNCSFEQAAAALETAWNSGLPILCHHLKFDMAVATEQLKLPLPAWQKTHDTLFLSFLADPHAQELELKELCADLLHWPAEERDVVVDWVMDNAERLPKLPHCKTGKLCGPSRSKKTKDGIYAGAWIGYAPGEIVGPYACGDVDRTAGLFEHLLPIVQREGMGAAYDRERRLVPMFMENERVGMRVDMKGLDRDVTAYSLDMNFVERALRDVLKAPGLDFDEDVAVGQVLLKRGIVPAENWTMTKGRKDRKTGLIIPGSQQLSVSKDNLYPDMFTGDGGAEIASALGYRNRLKTCLEMFMKPWLDQASHNNGYITTNWNQTRGYEGGTRTGRPSTSHHNFLNISKNFEGRDDGYKHPDFLGVAMLPLVRRYVLPDEGGVFLHRDFDGQEMRVFAHGSCGKLKAQYTENPKLKPHIIVGDEMSAVAGRTIDYTKAKSLNFQGIYGGGVPALSRKLRISSADARELKTWHDKVLPDRKIMVDAIKSIVARGEPIRTLFGRVYYCEPARVIDGRMRSMDYKLINYYCQGSAADITKEACAQWWEHGYQLRKQGVRFLVTVYDEINKSSPPELEKQAMDFLRDTMEQGWLDIAMPSDGKRGLNWGELTKCA